MAPVSSLVEDLGRLLGEGKVLGGGEAGAHGEAWNALLDGNNQASVLAPPTPALVARVTSAQEVLVCATFAAQHQLKLSAKGTGHQYGGAFLPPSGGLLVDMGAMLAASIDAAARTISFEPGCTSGQVRELTAPHGLHFTGGHISSVGATGFVLGGGNGYGQPLWGCGADSALSFQVVSLWEAEPRLVEVTAASDPDLFWALRGGGPFVALVTRITAHVYPVPDELPVQVAGFAGGQAAVEAACSAWLAWQEVAPAAIETTLVLSAAAEGGEAATGGGQPAAQAQVVNVAFDLGPQVEAALQQVRDLAGRHSGRLLADSPQPYLPALAAPDASWLLPRTACYMASHFVRAQHAQRALEVAARAAARGCGPLSRVLVFRPTYRGDSAAASFAGCYMFLVYAMWQLPRQQQQAAGQGPAAAGNGGDGAQCRCSGADGKAEGAAACGSCSSSRGEVEAEAQAQVAWLREAAAELAPLREGCYLCEGMHDEPGSAAACYSREALTRLRAVKARCDPGSLLRAL